MALAAVSGASRETTHGAGIEFSSLCELFLCFVSFLLFLVLFIFALVFLGFRFWVLFISSWAGCKKQSAFCKPVPRVVE